MTRWLTLWAITTCLAAGIGYIAGDKIPYVAHRRNRCNWLVTVRADDFFKLVREYI